MKTAITITDSSIKDLEKAYKEASDSGKESFEFEEAVLLTDYAKYFIEYAKSELEKGSLITLTVKD